MPSQHTTLPSPLLCTVKVFQAEGSKNQSEERWGEWIEIYVIYYQKYSLIMDSAELFLAMHGFNLYLQWTKRGWLPWQGLACECTSYIEWDQSWYFQSLQRNSGWIYKLCHNLHVHSLIICITCSANTAGVVTHSVNCTSQQGIFFAEIMHSYIHTLCFRLTNFDTMFAPMQAISGSIRNSVHTAEQLTHRSQNLQILWWNDSPIYHYLTEQRAKNWSKGHLICRSGLTGPSGGCFLNKWVQWVTLPAHMQLEWLKGCHSITAHWVEWLISRSHNLQA